MRNRLKNSWCELEDFVWRWCEMLPHFPSRPRGNGPHSSLLVELEKQRTGSSETTALNTALPSPWQRAPAHPRRAPRCFALHLTQKNAGSGSSRSNFRVQVRSVGSEENGGGGAILNALHAGISTHTHTFDAHPAVLYRHLSETHQTSLQEPRGRAVIKVT